jgi:hypothetical protein
LLGNDTWNKAAIDNPNEPRLDQGRDDALHIPRAVVPNSVGQGAKQGNAGADVDRLIGQFFGITPAP